MRKRCAFATTPDLMVSFQITNSQYGPFAQLFALAGANKWLYDLWCSAGGLESTTASHTSSHAANALPCAMSVVVWPKLLAQKKGWTGATGFVTRFYTKTKCRVQNKDSHWTSTLYYEQDGPALHFLPQTAYCRLFPFNILLTAWNQSNPNADSAINSWYFRRLLIF